MDNICNYNYDTKQGICTSHSFPLTRSQAKVQKIAIPSLYKTDKATSGPSQKASILRDPPAVMARNRSTDLSQTVPEKRGCGRPPAIRVSPPIASAPNIEENVADDLNNTLPTLYPARCCRRQPAPIPPHVLAPPEPPLFHYDETTLKQIHI